MNEPQTPADAAALLRAENERQRLARQQLVQGFPATRLERRHLADARLLPHRNDLLAELPKGGTVCEIGVANGDFSAKIMEICRPDTLHLVDAWEAERYKADQLGVQTRFAGEIRAGRVRLHLGLSTERLPGFPDGSLDWAYIDTVHDYRITALELELCRAKVKPGGIIAGHDYTVGNIVGPVPYGVINAVQEFCVQHNWKYIWLTCESHGYWSFALKEITPKS